MKIKLNFFSYSLDSREQRFNFYFFKSFNFYFLNNNTFVLEVTPAVLRGCSVSLLRSDPLMMLGRLCVVLEIWIWVTVDIASSKLSALPPIVSVKPPIVSIVSIFKWYMLILLIETVFAGEFVYSDSTLYFSIIALSYYNCFLFILVFGLPLRLLRDYLFLYSGMNPGP